MPAAVRDRLADYIPVNERLDQFWTQSPNGRVLTTVVEHNGEQGFILMRAEIYRQQGDIVPAATGHAYEMRDEGYVNKTSYIENCETSAVGRALALLGYEIKRGIASREEMQKVERMTTPRPAPVPSEKDTLLKGAVEACKLLNQAGDKPAWGTKRLNEFAMQEYGAKAEALELEPLRELLKKLSLKHDAVKAATKGGDQSEIERQAMIAKIQANNLDAAIRNGLTDMANRAGRQDVPTLDQLSLDQLIALSDDIVPF